MNKRKIPLGCAALALSIALPVFAGEWQTSEDFGLVGGPRELIAVKTITGFVNEKTYDVSGKVEVELCLPNGKCLQNVGLGAPAGNSHPSFVFEVERFADGHLYQMLYPGEYQLRLVIDGEVKETTPFWLTAEKGKSVEIVPDFQGDAGIVKPLNGIGQGPLLGYDNYKLFHYLKEANVPYSRTHDVGGPFGKNLFFDIPNLFRNFDADENDPANYDFTFTDQYVKNLIDNDVEVYFRLGVTIENACYVKSYRIVPPKDFAKWARICEHVIRHYNEGWANGFKYGIKRWEIWNEPDNCVGTASASMWAAPFSEYIRFYEVAATHLKKTFPDLEIGGYGSSGLYYHTKSPNHNTGSNARPEQLYNDFHKFIKHVTEKKLPLDFFSFHGYDAPQYLIEQINYVREVLDKAGYKHTKLSMNEWIQSSSWNDTPWQTAQAMSTVCGMQYSALDDSEIYDGKCGPSNYSPLFDIITHRPRRLYYAWKWFGEMRTYDKAIPVKVTEAGGDAQYDVWSMGAVKGDKARLLITNCGITERPLSLALPAGYRVTGCRIINDNQTNRDCALPKVLAPNTVLRVDCKTE